MNWFSRDKTHAEDGPTKVWALLFDRDNHEDIDLHLPRYLYLGKLEPKKWNRIRWRDMVTGSCIVRIGWRLYVLTARPPSSLEVSTSDYATGDPSGSCLIASTATIPTPVRTVYLGVVEYESSRHGCALIQLDTVYLQDVLAGLPIAGTSFVVDREWMERRNAAPRRVSEEFCLRTAKKPKSNRERDAKEIENRLKQSDVSLQAQDRGALVISEDGKAIGMALGHIESQDDPAKQNVVQILPFDQNFWRNLARHVDRSNPQERVYEVWVDMIVE
ncbi:hypothetical protein F4776DRAFT_232918 [Hypoxylon sp. NC0597]|nr:hypothetical protein F4776DRAFT_232918 [Hypoxylon sp. NC0597]